MHKRTAPRCNTLHHAATHCTSLQHTTPHCNTLRVWVSVVLCGLYVLCVSLACVQTPSACTHVSMCVYTGLSYMCDHISLCVQVSTVYGPLLCVWVSSVYRPLLRVRVSGVLCGYCVLFLSFVCVSTPSLCTYVSMCVYIGLCYVCNNISLFVWGGYD